MRTHFTFALSLLVLACFAQACSKQVFWENTEKTAPTQSFTTIQGDAFRFASDADVVTIVHFWSLRQPLSIKSLEQVSDIQAHYASNPLVRIVSVHIPWGSTDHELRSVIQQKKLSLPVLNDADKSISKQLEVSSLPQTMLLDKKGVFRFQSIGMVDEHVHMKGLHQRVNQLLK